MLTTHSKPPTMSFSVHNEVTSSMQGNQKSESSSSPTPQGSNSGAAAFKKQKNIPVELTAYGTTPSGKPRLFECRVCTRAFARLEHLRRHERLHTKEKPFLCGVCQRKFLRRDLLLRHAQKLHAGCSDAITRLRRKLMKSGGQSNDLDMDDDDETLQSPENDEKDFHLHDDSVQFNLNSFSFSSSSRNGPDGSIKNTDESPSLKEAAALLQKQMLERKKALLGRSRGVLFSAQSGPNYAVGILEFNEIYPATENVEFSTPQLLPLSAGDLSWMGNVPSLSSGNQGNQRDQGHQGNTHGNQDINRAGKMSITPLLLDEIPSGASNRGLFLLSSLSSFMAGPGSGKGRHGSGHGSGLHGNGKNGVNGANGGKNGANLIHMRSDSINSMNSSLNTFDGSNTLYMMPVDLMALEIGSLNGQFQTMPSSNLSGLIPAHTLSEEYGYSFYDIPELMLSVVNNDHFKLPTGLSAIQQESDGAPTPPAATNFRNSGSTKQGYHGNPNLDMNFLNDISELAHEYDVNLKFMPNGYSFYGDNASVASSGIDTNSPPNHTPSADPSATLHNPQILNIEKSLSPLEGNRVLHSNRVKSSTRPHNNYNKNKLFTTGLRHLITKALGKYPISGIMTPLIPLNEKLEYYLMNFVNIFLLHFPFIHILKLNEYEMMSMTANEDMSNESSRVCLPLLVATIGALLTNNKNDLEHLYEALRRTIHIYLESRKNNPTPADSNDDLANSQLVNPLWLIQLLTLLVIYGLFLDNENNVYIVIRQLNALNLLVKTSIKRNRKILFLIYGEDHETYTQCEEDLTHGNGINNGLLFSYDTHEEMKFKNSIIVQSQKRIVFMIYRLTNFLLMMYNVPLTLSINDLGFLEAPNKCEEYIWSFKSFQHFQLLKQQHADRPDINELLKVSKSTQIVFREALLQITKSFGGDPTVDPSQLVFKLNNLSRFGFILIVHGIFEIKQYQEMKSIDVFVILDNLTKFIGNSSETLLNLKLEQINRTQEDFEKLDYALLANFTKILLLINIKLVKEQSWLKNYDELLKNFNNLLMNANAISNFDYLKIVDCCIVILKLILFKTDVDEATVAPDGNFFVRTDDFHELVDELLLNMASQTNNTLQEFEKFLHLKVFNEFDNLKALIHLQMLFHIFTIFLLFATFMIRKNHFKSKNHIINEFQSASSNEYENELNQRYELVMQILMKIELFLKEKLENMNLESDFASIYLYSSNGGLSNDAYSLERPLYVLKIGEMILRYVFDMNVKVSIFQKLSASMSQLRKFMIDNEGRILA